MLKIGILDTRFDRVEGCCDTYRRNSARYRGDKVLRPRRLAIVRYAEDIILCNRAGTEQLRHPHSSAKKGSRLCGEATNRKRAWSVAGDRPAPAPIQRRTLLHEDSDDATATERVRVDLSLDLERVKREKNHLANTRQAACGRLHHHPSLSFAKHVCEARLVVPREYVIDPRLATKLVDSL